MKYPVELYCECGLKAKYEFQTEASYEEFQALWKIEHNGNGHSDISEGEYRTVVARKKSTSLSTTSQHEAKRMADLIMPIQIEEIKGACQILETEPQAETQVMFGDNVNFYQLHRNSAKTLAVKLRNALTLKAFEMAYKSHNAPEHDKATCLVCNRESGL